MKKEIKIRIAPEIALNNLMLKQYVADYLNIDASTIFHTEKLKQSIDARGQKIFFELHLQIFIHEDFAPKEEQLKSNYQNVSKCQEIAIIGFGPAGIFAALKLIELGLKPIVVERGKNVNERRRDIAQLTKYAILNPESNYCFGEGGAGTYSDGKLYTRATKRGDVKKILNTLVQHGAENNILFEAHPHIGTNKLPKIIENLRKTIIAFGGEVHFNSRVDSFEFNASGICKSVVLADGTKIKASHFILATGHSAKDIFETLQRQNIQIEIKPFAMGVRVEHPQELINDILYKNKTGCEFLPPASYHLVHQANAGSVFSFCMCPGGIIAPAMTQPNEVVVNGWSPSRRNNPFANSGMVVGVEAKHCTNFKDKMELAALYLQIDIEHKAFKAGGGNFKAPAQRMTDFVQQKISNHLPSNSYFLGVQSANLNQVLPPFIYQALSESLLFFNQKMKGYYTEEAILVGVESRTSTPVRIPRNPINLQHPQIINLYPCGEGAGYAGGIMSAAIDGENCAKAIAQTYGL